MEWTDKKQFESFSAIACPNKPLFDFDVPLGQLNFACRLARRAEATSLIVSMTGFINRSVWEPPSFLRWNRNMRSHVLAVSDPTFLLHPSIRSGFFVGTRDDDAISGLLELVHAVAASLGVDRSRIVYWASSSGGFGAAMAAIRSGNGQAVVVNSAFELEKFKTRPAAPTLNRLFHDGTIDEMFTGFPLRLSVSAALTKARQDGARPKLLVVQNTVDAIFHNQHYTPFCHAVGLPVAGGFDQTGMLKSMVYSDPSGHGAEPKSVADQIVSGDFPLVFG